MKNIFTTLFFSFMVLAAFAQQEDQFTQFMYYKMGFNPAYAGSNDAACITALVRNQWIGLEGAPESQLLTFNMPLLNKRIGIGGSILRSTIGIAERYTAEAVYAYRIRMGRGTLSIGLQGAVRFLRIDFNKVNATQPKETDGAIPVGIQSKYVPNFGAGLYYSSNQFYLGFSVPRLLENNIDLADTEATISREVRHIYAMAGMLFNVSDKFRIQPQVLLKYVGGAPFDADVNLNFIFADKFTTGISYRLGGSKSSGIGESVSLLVAAQISESMLFGISYDYTLSDLRDFNTGSIEGAIRFCIGGKSEGEEYINPRFF